VHSGNHFGRHMALKSPHMTVMTEFQISSCTHIESSIDTDALQLSTCPDEAIGALRLSKGRMASRLVRIVAISHRVTDHYAVQ